MDQEEYDAWQRKRSAKSLQKATGVKYTKALNYVKQLEHDEPEEHHHVFSTYGQGFEADGELIHQLICVTCTRKNFAFATKAGPVVED